MMGDIFQGSTVRLRAIETANWEIFYEWNFDTDGARSSYEIPFPASRNRVREEVEATAKSASKQDNFDFQIERLDGELVGTISSHHCNPRCGTFMYGLGIRPGFRQQGYASEAIRLLLRFYFQERRYQKVNAEVYSFNEASMRLHQSLGFMLEGTLRRMIYTNGQYFDVLQYGMTAEEFRARYDEFVG